jgi:hypothetical protein
LACRVLPFLPRNPSETPCPLGRQNYFKKDGCCFRVRGKKKTFQKWEDTSLVRKG